MSEEKKALSFEFEGSNLIIKADPNKDGENVIEIKVALAEVPDEILGVMGK